MKTPEVLMLFILFLPWAGAGLIAVFHQKPNLRELSSVSIALALLYCVIQLYPYALSRQEFSFTAFELFRGIPFSFRLEPLGMLFICVAALLWVVNTLYSIGYMRANREQNQTRFYICFAVAIGSTMGLALSANLLTLFIFYEVLTLSTYPLVTHKGTSVAMKGGRIYLGYLLSSSIAFFLFAILWTWHATGTLSFEVGGILKGSVDNNTGSILFMLFLFGVGKAAVMPMHRWLPAAMVAPTPVSALLHAVAVVKAGVFTLTKIVIYIFGTDYLSTLPAAQWGVYLAGSTIIIASIIALRQNNLKKRLAYSTISQLSYIVMAACLWTPLAITAAALHIVVHAFGKITLFFAAGSIYTAHHKTLISELPGIGKAMPWTMAAFTIAALSMIGLPPAAGFISKWYLLGGTVQLSVINWFAVAVIFISTLLNAAYFLPIIYNAYFKPSINNEFSQYKESPLLMVIALCSTALLTLAVFFYAEPFLELIRVLTGRG